METNSGIRSRGRTGRPRDVAADGLILAVALELLAERGGYDRLTLDEVAARTGRAKTTLYRRWSTKEELVLAALRSAGRPPEAEQLPDSGSLRSDLLAVVDSPWLGGPERRLALFAGLSGATTTGPRIVAAVREEVTDPYADVYRRLLHRAHERGEIATAAPQTLDLLAQVIPAMSSYRLGAGGDPVDREHYVAVIDDIVLAALGVPRATDGDDGRGR